MPCRVLPLHPSTLDLVSDHGDKMWPYWTAEGLRTFPRTILGRWTPLSWAPLAVEMWERDTMLAIILRLRREPKVYRWLAGGQEGRVSTAKEAALAADRVLRDAGFVLLNKAWPTDAEVFNAPSEEVPANESLEAANRFQTPGGGTRP